MTIVLVDSDAVGFADGNGGHAYSFPAGAPTVGDLDVLCVNSNTIVDTPSGFTARVTAVANQGSYVFTRKASGGEADSVTVTTSGDHNTTLTWSRWSGTDAYSDGTAAQANNSNNTVLPAASTGALAAAGMLVIAFGALHNHDGALAASPNWINSFNPLEAVSQGSAGASDSCVALTAYKTNAGTAAETIDSVSWTNNTRNRYALWVAFTAAAGATNYPVSVDGATTPSGALVQQTNRPVAGSSEPAGTFRTRVGKSLSGSTTPVGVATQLVAKVLSGTATPAGLALKLLARVFDGDILPTANLSRQTGKGLTGECAPAGATGKSAGKALVGATTPTGAVTRHIARSFAGAVTPVGAALRLLSRLLGGATTPAGTVATSIAQLRNLDVAAGAPRSRWHTSGPGIKWRTGPPRL